MTAASPPRIPPLPKKAWTDAARHVFGYWEGEAARANGSRSNTMMTLAQHPPLAIASLDLGRYFILNSTLSQRQQKFVVLRVAHLFGSPYQWAHNAAGALKMGVSAAQIEGLKEGPAAPIWGEDDRLLLSAIDQVAGGGRIDDATWAALAASMSTPRIMDLVHAVGYFTMVAWGLIAMGVELEADTGFSRTAEQLAAVAATDI